MANGSEQGGEGTYVSLADLMDPLAGSPTHGQRVPTSFVNPPVIGKLQKVTGSVTITRANVIVAQPAVSDLVYEGDLIETGIDGLVSIVFVDGTTFRLYDSAHMVLDEFVFSSERSSNSALFRVLNGRFSFLSGLVAATGRLMIDTAVARIQNTRPAAGIGGLAFTVFTVGLIHELNAASANIALLDDGTISCKDLKHGVFEIITKGDHPQRFIVDDPCVSIHFQIVGSQVRVSEVANSQGQMAAFHDAFLSTLDSFLRGQQDPLIQEWQHANADPHSTTTVGSSTQPGQQLGFAQLAPNSETTLITSAGGGSGGTTSGLTLAAAVNIPLNVIWDSSSSGTWPTSSGWNDGAPPLPIQNVIIDNNDNPTKVTFDTNASILGLTIEAGAILNIVGGSLTVTEATTNSGLIEINSSGVDPTFAITGNISLLGGGEIWLRPPASPNPAANMIIAVGASTLTNVNNTIFGSGTIGTGDGTLTLINDAAGTIDALGGTLILDTGHTINNSGILAAGLVTAVTTALTGTATGSGTLQIDDAVDNTGNLDAGHNSTLIVDGPVTDTGSATIGANAILEFQSSVSATQTIAYTGSPGTLALSDPTDFHASIIGLIDGDKIDLTDIAPSDIASATIEGSTLVVLETTGAGGAALTFNIAGSLSGSYFSVQSDGGVGSDLILQLTVSTEDEWIKPSYVPALYVDGSGQWNSTAANVWSDGVPTSTSNVLVDLSGAYTITVSGAETANSLTISDSNATVSGSGSLSIATITNSGEIEALGGMLTIYPSTIGNAGTLAADSAQLDLVSLTVTNTGAVEATGADGIIDLQNVLRISGGVVTTMAASDAIEATSGTSTIEDVTSFTNAGLLEAIDGATLVLGGETVTNTGTVEADDATSTIDLQNAIISGGTVETGGNGILDLTGSALLEDGSFDNAGKVNVSGGGNGIENETSITNSGAFEVMPSGALTLSTDGTIDNTTGSFTVDGTGTLTVNDTTIQYGSVSVDNSGGNGILDLTGSALLEDGSFDNAGKVNVSGGGNGIENETSITNSGAFEVMPSGALTLSTDGTIDNTTGSFTVDGTGTLTVNDTTIQYGSVSVDNSGGNGILDLTGSALLEDGSFDNAGKVNVSGGGNGIENETSITNSGAFEVMPSGALTLSTDGTIDNTTGSFTVDGTGTLTVNDTTIQYGSVSVDNSGGNGILDLTGSALLEDGSFDNAGKVNVSGGGNGIENETSITNSGAFEVMPSGALTLSTDGTIDNTTGSFTVDGTGTLTVNDTTIQYGSVSVDNSGGNGILDLTGSALLEDGSFDNAGKVNVSGGGNGIENETSITNSGAFEVMPSGALTLSTDGTIDNTTGSFTVDGTGTLTVNDTTIQYGSVSVDNSGGNGILDLTGSALLEDGSFDNAGKVNVSGGGNGIENETSITNSGAFEVMPSGALTLSTDGTIDNTTGSFTVDGTGTLTVNDTTIQYGSVSVDNSGGNGILDLTGSALLEDGSFDNAGKVNVSGGGNGIENETSITNSGAFEVMPSGALTLSTDGTIDNTTGSFTVDGTGTLTVNDTTIQYGSVSVDNSGGNGILDLTGSALLEDGSFDNAGKVNVSGGGNGIENETSITNSGAFEVMPSGALTLSTDGTIDNTTGSFTVDGTGTLTVNDTTIQYGSVSVDGLLDSTGTSSISDAAITITSTGKLEATGGTLTIDPSTISNAGTLEANGAQLDLVSLTVTNTGTVEATGTDGIIDLQNATIDGGTVSTGSGDAIEATVGTSTIENTINFSNAGTLEANGAQLDLVSLTVTNTGTVEATGTDGIIDLQNATIDGGTVSTGSGDAIEATVGTSTIENTINFSNAGTLAANGAQLDLGGLTVTNTGTVEATGTEGIIDLQNATIDAVTNTGTVEATGPEGIIDLQNATIDGGTVSTGSGDAIEATVGTSTIENTINFSNAGTLAANGAQLDLGGLTVTNTGTVEATGTEGIIDLQNATIDAVTNTGTVEATGTEGIIDLQNATIDGGTVSTGSGDAIEATVGTSTIENTINFSNAGTLAANGAQLDLGGLTVTNTGTVEATGTEGIIDLQNATIDAVTNTGTVEATGTEGIIDLQNATIDGGTVSTGSGDAIEATVGTSTIENTINFSNAGTLAANGAQLDLGGLTVTNTGTVEATGTEGIIDLQNATIDGGTVSTGSGDAIEATVGTSTIENTINFSNAGTLAANGAQLDLGGLTVTNTGTVEATGTEGIIDLQNATIDGGTVNVYGLLDSTGISAIDGATITNTGTIETTAGTLTIDPGSLTNSGLLEASGGALIGGTWTMNGNDPSELIVDSSVNNSGGMIDVQYGSTVDIAGSISGGNAIIDGGTLTYGGSSSVATSFDGIGMLVLDGTNASNHFTGTLSDFGNGDIIDLAGIAYSNAHLTYDDDTLTVSDGLSGPSITIQLAGSYVASNFVLSKDANGDAEVTFTSGEEAYEAPTLWLGGTTATVSVDGTVTLPSITAIPVDSDDKLTVTIDGLPTGATITDNGTVFSGSSITLTEATVGTTFSLDDLTLNDGTTNTASFTLEVTANNTTFGEQGSSATQDITVMVTPDAPAGVAGSAINLALANPSAADGEPVAITVTGVPSGWQLNEGTNLGNGTWTVEPNDLGALTVTTANEFTGAMVLQVTETWTNADGSTGIAIVADNVEAYAPGSPIFALSGADTLTGAGANDVFVFAQPIGNDTIHNFNPASDKIDLVGFTNINGFSDIQADISQDSGGDAVITLASGETITLHGVSAAALSASDFVFNETPVTENSGDMTISDGAVLPLGGTIDNTGTIALNSTGDQTELQIVGAGVMLQGGGEVVLSDSSDNVIVGTNAATTLTNVDNTMSGAGQIGIGDGNLTLVNEAHGIIDANVSGETLTINTGNAMTNTGTLEASNGGTLLIDDAVNNSGAGTALIEGGIVDFASTTNVNEITFNNGSGSPTYGELVLGDPTNGQNVTISGFTGTAPNLTDSDSIDLAGTWTVESETSSGGNTVLSLKDGPATVTLTFDDFNGTLNVASDGNGGMLITDPPATQSCGSPVSIGGPGNDNFIFHPSLGADTGHFDPAADTTEYGQFSSPVEQHWALQIREDTIECAHAGDASTPPDLDATHVHFALHNAFHLQ